MKKTIYSKLSTRKIVYPLGGMGTGCIGLSGNGRLLNFAVCNTPDVKMNSECCDGFSFFAIKAEKNGKLVDMRALYSKTDKETASFQNSNTKNTDDNFYAKSLERFPCFENTDFTCCFPFAIINFGSESFPADVKMTAFNPFIVANDLDSSIPCAMFEFEIYNNTCEDLDYTICQSISGMPFSTNNSYYSDNDGIIKSISLKPFDEKVHPSSYTEMCIATDCPDTSYTEYWLRGNQSESFEWFFSNFSRNEKIPKLNYRTPSELRDTSSLCGHVSIAAGQKKHIRFTISWYSPYSLNYWSPAQKDENESQKDFLDKNSWKNYYANFYRSAYESSVYCLRRWDRLFKDSKVFADSLYSSTLPDEIIESVANNLCVLKSPSFMRNSDGTLYCYEGNYEHGPISRGFCSPVYNYAYALAFLFPKLERDIVVDSYKINQDIYGAVNVFTLVPKGRRPDVFYPFADGQFGTVLRVYREFKSCGDKDWLMEIWNRVTLSLDFAFDRHNFFLWDSEKNGVLKGCQPHTFGTELFSSSSWLGGMYLASLKAGAEMAEVVGDKKHMSEYRQMFENGQKWVDANLFNGSYYFQKINLNDKSLIAPFAKSSDTEATSDTYSFYWDDDSNEIKYQIGDGCQADQLLAQWHAEMIGLGEIFDKKQVYSALNAIYNNNFKPAKASESCFDFDEEGAEQGVVLCSYPDGSKKPLFPLPYADNYFSGIEYQIACHMLLEGMTNQALNILKAVRNRYDGKKRNPFAECEFETSSVRSLSSFGLLNACSGFKFDLYNNFIGFNPVMDFACNGTFVSCFAVNGAFGIVERGPDYLEVKILSGEIKIRYIGCPSKPLRLLYHGKNWDCKVIKNNVADMGNIYALNSEKGVMIYL